MRKQFLFVAVTALAMASCSEDAQMAVNHGAAIDFRGAMATRATETTTAKLNNIFVTALDATGTGFFTDVQFTKGAGGTFNSATSYYWPSDDSQLNFFAYAPSSTDLGSTVTINNTTKELAGFSPATTITDQKDFVSCQANGKKSTHESTGVSLTFKHQLSQIEIQAKNNNNAYVYKVVAVRIGQPKSDGTFDFGTGTWTPGANKTNYAVADYSAITLTGTAQSLMGMNDNAMLIPQQLVAWDPDTDKPNTNKGAYLAVKLQITTAAGARVYPHTSVGNYDWAAVPINTNWTAGNKYVYTLDFTNGAGRVDPEKGTVTPPDPFNPGDNILGGTPIKFTVTVDPWTDQPENVGM